MKEKIKLFLKKFPTFYQLFENIYWKVGSLRAKFLGTKFEEKRWREKYFEIEKAIKENLNHPHRQLLLEKIKKFYPFSRILEIGCAYGPNLYWLAKEFPQVELAGIDINPTSIREGKKWLERENILNVKLDVSKADELKRFKDKSFDIVFTDAVLMYIGPDKIKKVIKEMARIAKKALIFIEWQSGKEEYDAHIGIWKRNYLSLLKNFFEEKQVSLFKIPNQFWPDKNWQKYGYIIEVSL